MNTADKLPAYMEAVSRWAYRGVWVFETGDDLRIFIGQKEYSFTTEQQVIDFIDKALSTIVVLH